MLAEVAQLYHERGLLRKACHKLNQVATLCLSRREAWRAFPIALFAARIHGLRVTATAIREDEAQNDAQATARGMHSMFAHQRGEAPLPCCG